MRAGSIGRGRVLLTAALLLLVTATLRAEEPERGVRARWNALTAEAVSRLHSLAAWCLERQLFACRADVQERLLRLSPDDEEARKALRYVRDRSGGWARDPKHKPVKNLAAGAKDYDARLAELSAWLAGEAAPLIDEARSAAPRERSAWMAAVLAVFPESAAPRAWNGEVLDERTPAGGAPRWILLETQRTRTRRPALRQAGLDAVKQAPEPKPGTLESVDRHGGLEWPTLLQSERVRVLGFPDKEELGFTARHVEATWPLFEAALGRRPGPLGEALVYSRGLTVYSFDIPEDGMGWLRAQPGATERWLDFVRPLVGTRLPKRSALVLKSSQRDIRLEAAPRAIIHEHIQGVLGLTTKQAWILEGLMIYLTYQITGTRRIFSVNDVEARYAETQPAIPEHTARMSDASADWLDLCRQLVESPEKPDLFLMPGKDFNTISKPEVLYAYGIAAFAVEGLGERALPFFRSLVQESGVDLDAACVASLGYDAKTLEARVRRWLAETLPLTPP